MQGWRSLLASVWRRTAPAVSRKASVMIENGWMTSGIWSMGAEEKMHLSSSNAHCCNKVQFQGSFFLVRRLRGAMILEKFGMNF